MRRISVISGCVFSLVVATAAFGQNPSPVPQDKAAKHQHKKLKKMDTNRDGQLTRDEWKGKPKKFDKLDANHDGILTKEELKMGRRKDQRPTP